jgi:hypothetical protein
MMTHIEGPIVDSFYDMSLLSWAEVFRPPLPLLKGGGGAAKEGEEYKFAEENRYLKGLPLSDVAQRFALNYHHVHRYLPRGRRQN